jgi:hypothetical protein
MMAWGAFVGMAVLFFFLELQMTGTLTVRAPVHTASSRDTCILQRPLLWPPPLTMCRVGLQRRPLICVVLWLRLHTFLTQRKRGRARTVAHPAAETAFLEAQAALQGANETEQRLIQDLLDHMRSLELDRRLQGGTPRSHDA